MTPPAGRPPTPPRWLRWLLGAATRLLPHDFRRDYARDLDELYADLSLSGRGNVGVATTIAIDMVKNAVAVRWDNRRYRPSTRPHPGRGGLLESTLRDVVFAVRGLRRNPTFSLLAGLTLAVGVGATTAMFSVVHRVILQPLPYDAPHELVRIWPDRTFNQWMFAFFGREARTFAEVAVVSGWGFTLTGEGEPEALSGAQVSTNYFRLLGVGPALGRAFVTEDREPARGDVAILGHGLWQRRFGGDSSVVGRRVEIGGADRSTVTIVGVMGPDFRPLQANWEVWMPLPRAADLETDASWFLSAVGRLRPGVTVEQATDEVARLAQRVKQERYTFIEDGVVATAAAHSLHDYLVGDDVQARLGILMASVGLVLLVACGNVANLLLARVGARERELAIRAALGAGRGRVVGHVLTESVVLGLAGGGAGVVLAAILIGAVRSHLPPDLHRGSEVGIDPGVLLFALAVSLLSGVVFGVLPALRAGGRGIESSLRAGGRGGVSRRRHRVSAGLIVAEVALSVMLVAAAGLTLRSLWNLTRVDPGFDPHDVLVMRVSAPDARYPEDAEQRTMMGEVLEGVRAVPGVREVGAIHLLPLTWGNWSFPYHSADRPVPEGAPPLLANFRIVVPGYFAAVRTPVLRGRGFTAADREDGAAVGMINRALAEFLWPDDDPIGKELTLFNPNGPRFTVVGVVGNVRQHGLDLPPQPEIYRPFHQWTVSNLFLTIRTAGAPQGSVAAVRAAIWAVDGDIPISDVQSLDAVVASSVSGSRFLAALLAGFAGVAVLLGAIGVYGVTSYLVSERSFETGVRMALGAPRRRVLRSSLLRGMVPVALGIGIGVSGALAASSVLSGVVFGVRPSDPVTLGAVAALLLIVAVVANYVPASRAAGTDPLIALRRH